jgi:two-component system, LytTR family, sensor kinase
MKDTVNDLVPEGPMIPRLPVTLIIALWTIPALLSTFETVVFASINGQPTPVWRAFVSEASGWYTWALITPLVIRMGIRFPVVRPLRWRHIAAHVGVLLSAGLAQAIVSSGVGHFVAITSRPFLPMVRAWYLSQLPFTLVIYVAIVGVSYALRERRRAEARERHAERLAKELAEAHVRALRMQLQPHFLFNTLNAIMALVRDVKTERAIQALSLLSDVLYTTIRAGDEQETTLEKELSFVGRYLEIERVRFGDRLNVAVDMAPGVANALVPTFLLQPFVENALRHGIAPRRPSGNVRLSAASEEAQLVMSVIDDGIGLPADWEERMSRGVGIANARARLARMYGDAGSVAILPRSVGSGTEVSVRLPLRFS